MNAIISTTYDDKYLFFLPIVTWAWNKLGVDVVLFLPKYKNSNEAEKLLLINKQKIITKSNLMYCYFECPENKKSTYAQCSRLFAGCLYFSDDEILITSDIDMAVFSKDLIQSDDNIHVWGTDLVPAGQIPICYISMPKSKWKQVIRCDNHSYQEMLDYHLGSIECENFRGNYWAKDQEMAFTHIMPHNFVEHKRAKPGTQFATRREDRDSWGNADRFNLIDAHLPRPGYTDENFEKILKLFKDVYPNDNFDWIIDYINEYIKLL